MTTNHETETPRAHKHQLGTIDKGIAAERGYIYPHETCQHDSYAICGTCVVEFGPEDSFCPICAMGV